MLRIIVAISIFTLFGCSSTPLNSLDKSQQVEVRIDGQFDPAQCEYLGEVTGSEGHWYNYLFYTNDSMITGAINDLKSNAMAISADTVFMISPQYFVTSFTVLGTAYRCK
ncbi:DUF4156 domain-containing protein [Vibrio parahaemolyticus]|nr:DUF4156 domain-containing protein [Vibrio parahaemolyticus]